MKRLENRVALVTGGGRGIGKAIAARLHAEGAKIAICGTTEDVLRQAAGDIGADVFPVVCDVSAADQVEAMVLQVRERFGKIDILVNNAAGLGSGMLVNTSEADWDYQTVPKLKGAFNTMRHAVPIMLQQKFGRVINVASDAWIGMNGLSAYSAANAGLVGLTKATAKELFRAGVTVNAVCPQAASPGHFIEFNAMIKKLTSLGVKIDEERMKKVEEDHGPAEDMAPFVAYLATEEAAFISGSVFSLTASGRVTLYSDPAPVQTIQKDGSPWTVEELIQQAPESLLKDYTSIAAVNVFG
jgi:3-oxoacyl-[acyl-carrier protein] reductase